MQKSILSLLIHPVIRRLIFLSLFIVSIILVLPFVFSIATTSSEFQEIGDPTFTDLMYVAHPTTADFNRLDKNEQKPLKKDIKWHEVFELD